MKNIHLREFILMALLSLSLVLCIDFFTNSIDTEHYCWDFKHYMAMARSGFQAEHMVAPFAYRFGATLPVWFLHNKANIPLDMAFTLITLTGVWITLISIYLFIRWMQFNREAAGLALLVVALSECQIKFHLFDVYQPDHLAYPLMVLVMALLIRQRWLAVVILAGIGLQIREFLIIPLIVLMVQQVKSLIGDHTIRRVLLFRLSVIIITTGLAVVVPRLLINVKDTIQNIDPFLAPESLKKLITDPLNWRKDVNFILGFCSYMLPIMLLLTPTRARELCRTFSEQEKWTWVPYTGLVLILALYGGSDYDRFMTYLFLPQCLLLSHLCTMKPHPAEIAYLLVVMVLINRIFLPFPIWDFELYANGHAWSDRINIATLHKFVYLGLAVIGAAANRFLCTKLERSLHKREIPLI
ncbi:hypothetical protein JXQ70_15320 [bacterium]|nr:hypothetical protein [bacterium]